MLHRLMAIVALAAFPAQAVIQYDQALRNPANSPNACLA